MSNDLSILLDLGGKLLLVLILVFLSTRLLRWLSNPTLAEASLLTILARQPIGAQQTLLLVGVGKKRLLLGQTPRQITLLAEIEDDDLPVPASHPRAKTTVAERLRFLPLGSARREAGGAGPTEPIRSTEVDRSADDAISNRAPGQPFATWLQCATARLARLRSAGSGRAMLLRPGEGACD